jgi:hypothetical protein
MVNEYYKEKTDFIRLRKRLFSSRIPHVQNEKKKRMKRLKRLFLGD